VKPIGCALLVLGVVVAGLLGVVGLAGWLLGRTPDQSHLATQVDVTVASAEKKSKRDGSNWLIDYSYRVRNQWYSGEEAVDSHAWSPDSPLSVCLDPDVPTEHVLKIHSDDRCGEEFIATRVLTGTPTTAPSR
jgi:hypothetical protein